MKVLFNGRLTGVSPIYRSQIKVVYDKLNYEEPRQYAYLSRYAVTMRIQDPERKNKLYYESVNDAIIPESINDIYITVDSSMKNRLDIVSNKVYKNPLQWWVIALANSINDPFDIPEGTILRIPPLSSVYSTQGLFITR